MDQTKTTANWIGAYLEWTNAGGWAFGPGPLARSVFGEASTIAGQEFAAAYLDWMDAWQQLCESSPHYHATATASDAGDIDDGIFEYEALDDDTVDYFTSGLDVFREALMVALHTESDCIQFLRRILDAGDTTARTVSFALEALEHAERLLEDERSAWRALTALSRRDLPQSSMAWRSDFEKNWPHALEDVAADVHALTSTVLALQAH
jgi:hypothetical protein